MSDERLASGHEARLLVLLSVGLATVRLGQCALPPLFPTVIADLLITTCEAGVALSLASVWFALLQFPGERLSD